MRYTIIMVLSIIVVMAAGIEGELCAQEWSEPVELAPEARNEFIDNDYETAVDSQGNIHLLFTVQQYNDQYQCNRLRYSKFDPHGESLQEPILLQGEDINTSHGKIYIDEDDLVHILFKGRDEDNNLQYLYTCYDQNGGYIVEPVIIEGLYYTVPYFPYQFFRRSDGTFIFTILAYHEHNEVDSAITHWVSYARFSEEGELIGEPHYLFTAEDPRYEEYYKLMSSVDSNDNLHLAWRLTNTDQEDYILYACVSPDDEIITEPTFITPQFNDRHYHLNGLSALNRQAVYVIMADNRPSEDPHITYLQKMNSECETEFYADIITDMNGDHSTYFNKWNNQFLFTGIIKPDTLDRSLYFYTSMDTTGNVIDEIELIRERPSPSSYPLQIQRAGDTLSVFNFRYYGWPEFGLEMVQKVVDNQSVSETNISYNPKHFFIDVAYPNPFNSTTTITYGLGKPAPTRLVVYDISGREIAVLLDGNETAGTHSVSWDATGLTSGVYFCRLQSEGQAKTVKLAMIR
ncbi:T9SS type A sorting domain-containing protein [bacterium]|nr:T9SS type A sorting domain-containing protein [bacterium]